MDQRDDAHASWRIGAGLLVLTLSCGAAVYRAAGDTTSVTFVVGSYATLLLLVACLRAYERAPPEEADRDGGGRRVRIRCAVSSLTTLLTVMFASRVATVMPTWPAALLVWALAAATTVGGLVVLFH